MALIWYTLYLLLTTIAIQIAFDLGYLRDQMTITEVTMARLYNWDVKRRKEKKETESAK